MGSWWHKIAILWVSVCQVYMTPSSATASYTRSQTDITLGFTCPWYWTAFGRKCYYTQGAHQSSSLAKHTCNINGGAQVVLEDQTDIDYLVSQNPYHSPVSHDGYWLRCKDEAAEGQWKCEGSANYWNSDMDSRGLWEWETGEPNGGRAENCLILNFGGKLSDVPCSLRFSFNVAACEITKIAAPTSTQPTPYMSTITTRHTTPSTSIYETRTPQYTTQPMITDARFTCPWYWTAFGRKCYYAQGAHQSWSLAKHTCNINGGVQVVVEDQTDIDYLISQNNDHSPVSHDGYWLRCKDDAAEGQWKCEDSTNYWNSDTDNRGLWEWDTGEPSGGTAENCLILNFGGKLSDVLCSLRFSFNVAACEITKIAAPTTQPIPSSHLTTVEPIPVESTTFEATTVSITEETTTDIVTDFITATAEFTTIDESTTTIDESTTSNSTTHDESTTPAPPSALVDCVDDTMTVYIPRFIIDNVLGDRLHFTDENCVGSNYNDTHVRIMTDLDKCGTTMEVEDEYVVFSNFIKYEAIATILDSIITRARNIKISVQCKMKRDGISSFSFNLQIY